MLAVPYSITQKIETTVADAKVRIDRNLQTQKTRAALTRVSAKTSGQEKGSKLNASGVLSQRWMASAIQPSPDEDSLRIAQP